MRKSRRIAGFLRCVSLVVSLSILTACATVHRRVSIVSPGRVTNSKDFDVDSLPRYKDAACAYRVGVGEKVAADKEGTLSCVLDTAVRGLATADHAKLFRNQIVDDLRKNIDTVYNEYV